MDNIFKGEQSRAAVGYIIVAVLTYYLNIFLAKTTDLTVTQTTFLAVYIIGNLVLYSFDMLFAKESFYIDGKLQIVPYTDVLTRLQLLGESFFHKQALRFIVTVSIDTIVGLVILKYVIDKLEELKLFPTWKYRNYIAAVLVAAFTYVLYLGTLRFKWAYQHESTPMMDILVIAWLSIILLLVASNPKILKSDIKWRMLYEN